MEMRNTWPFVRVNVKMSSSTGSTHVTTVTTQRLRERGAWRLYPVGSLIAGFKLAILAERVVALGASPYDQPERRKHLLRSRWYTDVC
jgi:hypothetical protein